MGEIAQDIIEGRSCGCGEYFEDGESPGFPRACSKACERDYGGMYIGGLRKRGKVGSREHPIFLSGRRTVQYDLGVDYKFFEAMGIRVIKHQPWQLGLYHEELKGKFLWYPKAGTLVYEGEFSVNVIGRKGLFPGHEEPSTEAVYDEIIKKVREQHS